LTTSYTDFLEIPKVSSVHWLSHEEHREWDDFVARHPLGLVYHLTSWQRALESAFGHIHGRFLVLRDDVGQIQAGLPVFNVRSWLLKNRTVSVPFATVCDPLISTKDEFDLLWPAIEGAAKGNRSKRIEIRTRRTSTDCVPAPLTIDSRFKHHYLPLGESTDTMFRSFHDSCVCRRIKKAKRAGVAIEERGDEQSLRTFHALMAATRRRLFLPPMPFAFFASLYAHLSPVHATLYLAVDKGEHVGGALVLKFKDFWIAEYSGHSDNAPAGADQLLYWHAIQEAKASGAAQFSFGRTSLDNTGLLEYKRRWATVEEDLTEFVCYPGSEQPQPAKSKGAVRQAFSMASRLLRYTPAAVQQSIGDFCYRHLG
jgi:CelD/BcsL family acetyltransferase involved in cellulose biosynthesis